VWATNKIRLYPYKKRKFRYKERESGRTWNTTENWSSATTSQGTTKTAKIMRSWAGGIKQSLARTNLINIWISDF
jgi:hypothetical protein